VRALLAAVAIVASLAFLAAPAAAKKPRTCSSPGAVFTDGAVRIWTRVGPLDNQQWWICSAQLRKPRLWNDQGQYIEDSEWQFHRFGDRIGYTWTWDDGAGADWEIGWVDVRNAGNKAYFIDYDDRSDSAGVETIAVAPNGDVAFLEQLGAERTGDQMEMIGVAKAGRKGLAEQLPLAVVPDWTIDPKSFEFDGTSASWRTKDGQAGSSLF
jgi:hypothetical protein